MLNRKWCALSSSAKSFGASARTALIAVMIAATALFTFGGVPTAAHAADVATIVDLEAALAGNDQTITLTKHITADATVLVVNRSLTLDLNEFNLHVASLEIAAGATVTLDAPPAAGLPGNGATVMTVNGTLVLASDMLMSGGARLVVGPTGKIMPDASPRNLVGTYEIRNYGTITAGIVGEERVSGNAFSVRFVDNLPGDDATWIDVPVFAPTLAAAGMMPPTFARTHATITGWNSQTDGTGSTFTTTTTLTATNWLQYAQWAPAGITSIGVEYAAPARAGDIRLVAVDTSPGGDNADISDFVEFTSDDAADLIERSPVSDIELQARLVGTRVITGTLRADTTVTAAVSIPVIFSPYPDLDSLALSMTPGGLAPGSTSAAYLSALDIYGNDIPENLIGTDACPDCYIELTSSESTDVIDQDTGIITFDTLGTRTITATLRVGEGGEGSATAPMIVELVPETPVTPEPPEPPAPPAPVPPAPAPPQVLAASGSETSVAPWIAIFMIALGAAAAFFARRRSA